MWLVIISSKAMPLPKLGEKKNLWASNCGNAIAEIGKKNFVTIVAMALPKMGGGKKCDSEIWGE